MDVDAPAAVAYECLPGVVVLGLVLHPLASRQVVAIHQHLSFDDDEVEAVVASDEAKALPVHRFPGRALEHGGHWFRQTAGQESKILS